MLLEFRVSNYRTFREEAVLSMVASNYDKKERETENVAVNEKFKLRLLKSAVVYGANASGKSKLFEALSFMRWFVLSSFQSLKTGDTIPVDPHLLRTGLENQPTRFEILFLHLDSLYRYGFEVNRSRVLKEWLFLREKRKEITLFERSEENIDAHPYLFKISNNEFFKPLIRSNCLLLSSAAQANDSNVHKIFEWFNKLRIISGVDLHAQEKMAVFKSHEPSVKQKILELLVAADTGIVNYDVDFSTPYVDLLAEPGVVTIDLESAGNPFGQITGVKTLHLRFNEKTGRTEHVELSMAKDESGGTRKFFAMAYPVIEALTEGSTLVVDELDSKLHPKLTDKIVELFNSMENSNGAQLIFNTHNTNLLESGLMRRDQVWFVEKDLYGSAKLFSLSDIQVRKNDKFEKEYLEGRYGAVPYLAEMGSFHFKESAGK